MECHPLSDYLKTLPDPQTAEEKELVTYSDAIDNVLLLQSLAAELADGLPAFPPDGSDDPSARSKPITLRSEQLRDIVQSLRSACETIETLGKIYEKQQRYIKWQADLIEEFRDEIRCLTSLGARKYE